MPGEPQEELPISHMSIGIFHQMILDMHGDSFIRRIEAWPFGNHTTGQAPFEVYSEVIIKPPRDMLRNEVTQRETCGLWRRSR